MDRRVELYYSKNGTVEILSQDSPPPIFSFFITIFCFLCGVSHNLIVLSAVLSNKTLRSSSVHQMMALVSLTCLMDCLTNESVAVGQLVNNVVSWCPLSALLFPLLLLLHAAALALLCSERTFALYESPLAPGTCLLGEVSAWLFALLFSLPLSAAGEVHYFRNRNSCGTVPHNSWAPSLFLLAILLCWTCQAAYSAVAVLTLRKQQQQTTFSPIPVSSLSGQPSSASLTVDVNRVCSRVLFLYVVLLTPQTVAVLVTLFQRLDLEPDPWLDPRDRQPRTVATADLELLLTYLRYMYNVAVPVVVLSSDPAVRRHARQLFCCSTNTVTTLTIAPGIELTTVKSPSYETPVLFSTPQGIHLRVAHRDPSSSDSIRLMTQFCDLTCSSPQEHRRNVRFSSRVEAISRTESFQVPRFSDTRTVLSPVLVRGDVDQPTESERTYTKF